METLFGTLVIAIPALLVGLFLFWSNYRPMFWMLAGALALGLGYLGYIGKTYEIGRPIATTIYGAASPATQMKIDKASEKVDAAKKVMKKKAEEAKTTIGEKMEDAKATVGKKMEDAKAAIGKKMEDAKQAAGTAVDAAKRAAGGSGKEASPAGRYVD